MTTEAEHEMNQRSADIRTLCNECVFAEWGGLTQTGCQLGRLDKFADQDLTKSINLIILFVMLVAVQSGLRDKMTQLKPLLLKPKLTLMLLLQYQKKRMIRLPS